MFATIREGVRVIMRSVILITASKTAAEDIYLQWKEEGKHIGFEPNQKGDKLGMEVRGQRIYVWGDGDSTAGGYEDGELQYVDVSHPYFYIICYSDREVMKYFIEKTKFPEDSYMDNDHESIIPVEEVRKDILGFIE